jgi:hypothetical protein
MVTSQLEGKKKSFSTLLLRCLDLPHSFSVFFSEDLLRKMETSRPLDQIGKFAKIGEAYKWMHDREREVLL